MWEVLRAARWEITVDGWHITATSPDRLARLEYRPPSSFGGRAVTRDGAWRARIIATSDAGLALWEAEFHSATPAHLVAALAAALADPALISRDRDCVPPECHAYMRPLTPDAPAVPRAAAVPTPRDLARARTVRDPAPVNVSVPRWSTTTRPPAPGAQRNAVAAAFARASLQSGKAPTASPGASRPREPAPGSPRPPQPGRISPAAYSSEPLTAPPYPLEPPIPSPDLTPVIDALYQLGGEFRALHARGRSLTSLPGSAAVNTIEPRLSAAPHRAAALSGAVPAARQVHRP
ncbi:protein of unknown function DUF317 [Actinobacteria bacterium OK074]|nr:protein of unknown function DUF317 [Actinobacteria bacterium OK074]